MSRGEMSTAEIQRTLDALTYPPNHCYNFQTMQATNASTAHRIKYLIPHIKPLITGKVVLDVGCAKGYLAIWSALNGAKKVIAQDKTPDFTNITAEIAQAKGIKNLETTTTDILSFETQGDIALVLGVAHYLTFEFKLDWLYKLYYLGYDILLEFPFAANDSTVRRMKGKAPAENIALLTEQALKQKVEELYSITYLGQSPGLHRNLYHLQKILLPQKHRNEIQGLRYGKSRGTTSIWTHGKDGMMLLRPKHLARDEGKGYPLCWLRAERVLAKEFPDIVPQPYMIVLDDNERRVGYIETRLEGGDPREGFRNLFTIQLYLMSIGLIQADLHTSDVHGNHILDHEAIEPYTPEADKAFRQRMPQTWRRGNTTGAKGLNLKAVDEFLKLLTTQESLKNIFTKARDFQWIV
jgi:SAM-dependent methyltransferase